MAADGEVLHGYYRWSDIFFEWCKVVDPDAVDPLKGALNSFALVHPDHPLRVKGEDGLRVYIGTMDDGQKRLLMKTEQCDYLRQWLHAVGLTAAPLPLPNSEFVLTAAHFPVVAQELFTSADAFKSTQKTFDRNNRRLKNVSLLLRARLRQFERARACWQAGAGTWLALDFEQWERDHTVVTEAGWASVRVVDGEDVRDAGHLVVRYESGVYYNGTYVEDNRTHYEWGTTEEVSYAELRLRLAQLIGGARAHGPVFLVFHDPSEDVRTLRALQAPIDGAADELPDAPPDAGTYVLDTAALFAALEGESAPQRRTLARTLALLGARPAFLHNAGNDAHWTLAALEAMARGEAADLQRARRWPQHVPHGPAPPGADPGLKVPFAPHEEDSDVSDTEGVLGRLPYDPKTGFLRGYGPDGRNVDEGDGVVGDGWGAAEPEAQHA